MKNFITQTKGLRTHPTRDKRQQIDCDPEINTVRRIAFIGESSGYYRWRSLIIGRLVRLVQKSSLGGWVCEFVHDDDRKAINRAAGWSENKTQYLLDSVKYK